MNYPTSIDTVNIGGTYVVKIEATEFEAAKTLNIGTSAGKGTLWFGGNLATLTMYGGNVTVGNRPSNTGTIDMTNSGQIHMTGTGNWISNPLWGGFFGTQPNLGTVYFEGTGAVPMYSPTFPNVTIQAPATVLSTSTWAAV